MKIKRIITGSLQENCYLVWNEQQDTLVIDPGDDAKQIEAVIKKEQLNVRAYLCTHGHADHIGALADLQTTHPAPIAMHSSDLAWAFESVNQFPPYCSVPAKPADATFLNMEMLDEWCPEPFELQCIETPGHSPGSCCLFFPEARILITGDTLFHCSCGRTDLPGGNPKQLITSLERLTQLPAETRVYPGHGPDTTIGAECATNPYL